MTERFNVLGVGVSAISMADAVATIDSWINDGRRSYVCITGVHGVMESLSDKELRAIHNAAGMVTPDGMPLVWLGQLAGQRRVERVYGPDLFLELMARSLETGSRHFLYGGGDGVAELLANRTRERFPGVDIVGTHTPPFRPLTQEEDDAIVDEINDSRADIVWVGLSTPKQERWMAAHLGRLNAAAMIGVGAAFDFHAGLKSQAPRWMQRSGLEWAFRLATEPRRLGRRYLANNPRFVIHALAQKLGLRSYPLVEQSDLAHRSGA